MLWPNWAGLQSDVMGHSPVKHAGEDPAELRALADQYFLRWEPATPEESFLVATLIEAGLAASPLCTPKSGTTSRFDDSLRNNPNGIGLNFIRCREYFPLLQRRIYSAQRTFHYFT
jgi:hypothetical protein